MRDPDAAFADPRLAVLYDELDGERSDLPVYLAIADELGARSVVDIGCGTGSLAVALAGTGRVVVGIDPALASLDVALTKPLSKRVTWFHGDATSIIGIDIAADLAVMTGNVAQVFVADDDWHETLAAVQGMVRPGGWFVFETRRTEARDWENWNVSPRTVHLRHGESVELSRIVTEVALPLVSFETRVTVGGQVVVSRSTLRFREVAEVERDLAQHGFATADVREAPDRPGLELVFLARC